MISDMMRMVSVMTFTTSYRFGFSTFLCFITKYVLENLLFFSKMLLLSLQAFFKEHPQFVKNDFYITGESYAGHYIPALASRVHRGNKNKEGTHINLKVKTSPLFLLFSC